MAKELNATCQICGKKYHMCRTCFSNKGTWKSWMQHTDTEKCFEIFTILYDLRLEQIKKEEAKERLNKCDLTGLNSFKENIKNTINEILGNKTEKSEKVKAVKEVKEVLEDKEDRNNTDNSVIVNTDKSDINVKTKKKFSL